MYSYNPDRHGLSEVKLLDLEPWRLYPGGDDLAPEFLGQAPPGGLLITRSTPIAAIGSCFVREIKRWLQASGYHFVETASGPCTEAGSARYDRVYNTFTIRQEFERAFAGFAPVETVWRFTDTEPRLLDPYRKNLAWDDDNEMRAELEQHRADVQKAFSSCEILIVTVGLSEIWFDKRDGSVFPLVPPTQIFDDAVHGFRNSTYEENVQNLERIHDLFIANNPSGHMIVTVSPVPLRATFRSTNALIANSAAKSTLRAAVDAFSTRHPQTVTYFPAYELVVDVLHDPYQADNRHVRPEAVDQIMRLFETWFVVPGPTHGTRTEAAPAS